MSRLPIISGMKAIKVFSKAGWVPHRQVGSHVVLRKEGIKEDAHDLCIFSVPRILYIYSGADNSIMKYHTPKQF